MSDQQVTPEQLDKLNEFGKRFMELKAYFLRLNLTNHENVRICVERLDDGFLRGREAIFSIPMTTEVLEDDKVANDPVPVEEIPLAASN